MSQGVDRLVDKSRGAAILIWRPGGLAGSGGLSCLRMSLELAGGVGNLLNTRFAGSGFKDFRLFGMEVIIDEVEEAVDSDEDVLKAEFGRFPFSWSLLFLLPSLLSRALVF